MIYFALHDENHQPHRVPFLCGYELRERMLPCFSFAIIRPVASQPMGVTHEWSGAKS